MAQIKPAEISEIIKKQISDINIDGKYEEVGTVLTIGDGIAIVYGLTQVQANELVEFLMALRV